MADRVIIRELINLIGVEVDPRSEESVNSFLGGIEAGVNRAGKFFFLLGELIDGVAKGLDATVGALFRLVTGVAKGADEMRLAAESAGVSTGSFQELAYAASTVGGEMSSVRAVLLEVAKGARMASQGNEQAQKSFAALGVSTRDAAGGLKAPNELLLDVAEALSTMPAGARRSAIAFDVLGAQGTKLLPVLSKGRAGLEALAKEGRELGVVLDDEAIRASDDYMTELGKLEAAIQGLRNAIGGPFLKVLTQMVTKLKDALIPLRGIIKTQAHNFVNKLTWAMNNGAKIADVLYDGLLLLSGLMLGRMLLALSTMTLAQLSWGTAALISGVRAAAAGALAAAGAVLALLPWLALGAAIILVGEEVASFFTGADSALKRFIKFLEKSDPSDSTFTKGLKAGLALIFDFTNPERWRVFWEAMQNFGMEAIQFIIKQVMRLAEVIRGLLPEGLITRVSSVVETVAPAAFPVLSGLGTLAAQSSPMSAAFGRGGSPGAAMQSVQSSQAGPTFFAPVFNLQQEVNAAPGQSAAQVGQAAAQSGEDFFSKELQRTLASFSR